MHLSEFKSVQVFQENITEHLPQYREKDVSEIYNTLKLAVSGAHHDSVFILKKELLDNSIEVESILSDLVTELAEYIFHHPDYSDPIIDLIRQKDLFSFSERLQDLKDLELALKRMERKRLKDELIKVDEDSVASVKGSRHIWLKVAAILVVMLVPLGILFFNNLNSPGSERLASNNGDGETNSSEVYSVGDLDALMTLSLPAEELNEAIVKVINEGGNLGYAQEDEEIKIIVISRIIQIAHLEEKTVLLEAKIKELESELNKSMKSGSGQGPKTKELKESIDKLERKQSEFLTLKSSILSKEMHYEFTGKELKIYSNKTGANRFSIESRLDLENDSKKEYFLFKNGVEYTKLKVMGAKK